MGKPYLPTQQTITDLKGQVTNVWQRFFEALNAQLDTLTTSVTTLTSSAAAQSRRVRVATTANLTISSGLNPGDTVDGVTLASGDLVLVKNQVSTFENGVYVCKVTPTRDTGFDEYNDHPGALLAVEEGTTQHDTVWLCTSDAGGTLGVTAIAFRQFGVGTTTYDDAFSSPPSSPALGDLWLPSDVPLLGRYDGSAWVYHGPIPHVADASQAGFTTWVNQGTSSIATLGNTQTLTGQKSGTTLTPAVRQRLVAVPAGNWTLTAAILPPVGVSATTSATSLTTVSEAGICLRNSTSGRIETLGVNYSSAQPKILYQNYLTSTAYIATPGALQIPIPALVWFRFVYTNVGQTVVASFSYDGQNWIPLFSGTTYTLGPDYCGIYVNPQQNVEDISMTLWSWDLG